MVDAGEEVCGLLSRGGVEVYSRSKSLTSSKIVNLSGALCSCCIGRLVGMEKPRGRNSSIANQKSACQELINFTDYKD